MPTPLVPMGSLHADAKWSHFLYTGIIVDGRCPTCTNRKKIDAELPTLPYFAVE